MAYLLIVDDDEDFASTTATVLRKEGYDVQIELDIDDPAFPSIRIFDSSGQDPQVLMYGTGQGPGASGNILINKTGVYGFFDAEPEFGQYRYMIQAEGGSVR